MKNVFVCLIAVLLVTVSTTANAWSVKGMLGIEKKVEPTVIIISDGSSVCTETRAPKSNPDVVVQTVCNTNTVRPDGTVISKVTTTTNQYYNGDLGITTMTKAARNIEPSEVASK